MGSRAVVYLRPDDGAVYTRTGRSFLSPALTEQFLGRVRAAVDAAGLWAELGTDWLLLDAELLPWSAKASGMLREQYAPVGAAARLALPAAVAALQAGADRGLEIDELLARTQARQANAEAYEQAWQRYVWPTEGLDGVQLAPFQVLAGAQGTYAERDHLWHLSIADRLVAADPELFRSTGRLVVDVADEASRASGIDWWLELTASGGEGMVVKPLANLSRTPKGSLVRPG